ncbi:MAG: DUF1800 family protein [Sphingomonadaceae bacterium]|nr:DUF1800 family protein [Sphingomonadaceae bacterium]
MSELPKTFDPSAIEAKWYAHWEETGAFRPHRPDAEPYTIVNPPPNVTGSLHIGHALDNTLQDILIRHARLQGKDALWVVGTDHAGIATQMVVERQLNEKGQKRTDFTREDFIAKVWDWKEESGGQITRQLRRLGCSMDWANERFTMDEGFSRAVLKVFVDLYNQKLIYRDKRLVNWDPGLKTAISDLEVETREVNGKFWHFRYPLADGSGHILVATTRPETMLADMAVAVNPEDDRYKAWVGKKVRLPITGREIPIVADEHADPELGSGAVKITPGHDFNDFEVGKRAGIKAADMLNMLDAEARDVSNSQTAGKVKEPLLRLTQLWRAYGASSPSGKIGTQSFCCPVAGSSPVHIFGQSPGQSPSVFNFFSPSYSPPGEIAQAGLVAPELQLANENLHTQMGWFFFVQTNYRTNRFNGTQDPKTMFINIDEEMRLADDVDALIDRAAEKLLGGSSAMTPALREKTRDQLRLWQIDPTFTGTNRTSHLDNMRQNRVSDALYLIVMSPEFAVQR